MCGDVRFSGTPLSVCLTIPLIVHRSVLVFDKTPIITLKLIMRILLTHVIKCIYMCILKGALICHFPKQKRTDLMLGTHGEY